MAMIWSRKELVLPSTPYRDGKREALLNTTPHVAEARHGVLSKRLRQWHDNKDSFRNRASCRWDKGEGLRNRTSCLCGKRDSFRDYVPWGHEKQDRFYNHALYEQGNAKGFRNYSAHGREKRKYTQRAPPHHIGGKMSDSTNPIRVKGDNFSNQALYGRPIRLMWKRRHRLSGFRHTGGLWTSPAALCVRVCSTRYLECSNGCQHFRKISSSSILFRATLLITK